MNCIWGNTMTSNLLEVRNLNVYYGQAHILQGVNMTVGAEPVALLGRNGMGKTTLCQALMGLLPIAQGDILFDGTKLDGRKIGAGALSGGEQQMLSIARALLTNARLLIMDEPSEGLAPSIIDHLLETLQRLSREGIGMLIVEQKLSVAAALANHVLVMVAGRIALETTSTALLADEETRRRYLGVGMSS